MRNQFEFVYVSDSLTPRANGFDDILEEDPNKILPNG